MWNPELVAKLEAERAQPPPKRNPDSPEAIAARHKIAIEIALAHPNGGPNGNTKRWA